MSASLCSMAAIATKPDLASRLQGYSNKNFGDQRKSLKPRWGKSRRSQQKKDPQVCLVTETNCRKGCLSKSPNAEKTLCQHHSSPLQSAHLSQEILPGETKISGDFLSSLNLSKNQLHELSITPGTFIYLTPREGLASTVYNLKVVDHLQSINETYYTLSKDGITYIRQNETAFIPLDIWEHEYRSFNCIKKYRKWKSFTVWKKAIRSVKIEATQRALLLNVFDFIPALRTALSHIRTHIVEVEQRRLLMVGSGRPYDLADFLVSQLQLHSEKQTYLEYFSNEIHEKLKCACDEVIDNFLAVNNIVADHKMTYMERASLRSECRKLTRFLRLVDFLVIDAMRSIALHSVRDAVDMLQGKPLCVSNVLYRRPDTNTAAVQHAMNREQTKGKESPSAGPLLTVYGNFGEDEEDEERVCLTPSLGDVVGSFKQIFKNGLSVLSTPERIYTHRDFAAYIMADPDAVEDPGNDIATIQTIVNNDDIYSGLSNDLYHQIQLGFEAASEYTEVFRLFRETFNSNDNFQRKFRKLLARAEPAKLSQAIQRYRQQVFDFEQIPYSATIGFLRVDSKDIKDEMTPSPQQCLKNVQELLPELIDETAKALTDQLSEVLPIVMGTPGTVEDFVRRKQVIEKAQQCMESYHSQQRRIEELTAIMRSQDWAIPEAQWDSIVIIAENTAALDNGIQAAEGREEENIKRFAAELESEIAVVKKKAGVIREQLDHGVVSQTETDPQRVLAWLEKVEIGLSALQTRAGQLREYQCTLGQQGEEFETLAEINAELGLKLHLWRAMKDWGALTARWTSTQLKDADAIALEKEVQLYQKTVAAVSRGLPGNPVAAALKAKVEEVSPVVPVVINLRNKAFKERHWEQLQKLVGFDLAGDHSFTLGRLIEQKVTAFAEEITSISGCATQEAVLEVMMEKIDRVWRDAELVVKPYKDSKDVFILTDVSPITTSLEDSLVTVNMVLSSRYVAGIRDSVEAWRKRLILFQDTLDDWLVCQRTWMYLESIFSSPDISRQLPVAAKLFQGVDKSFRSIMRSVSDDPSAMKQVNLKDRKETFQAHNAALDRIQKSLEDYLETKRASFPRFYFLSNDELLEILSQAKDPQAVQPHLRKCFDNLVRLDFGKEEGAIDILAMMSSERERVPLGKNLKARGNVEDWLAQVESRMRSQLHVLMKTGLLDYDSKSRKDWVVEHPGQVIATVAQIQWARQTEIALKCTEPVHAVGEWHKRYVQDLNDLIIKIRESISKLQRSIIVALITTDVHARDIIETLYDEKVDSVYNFTWQQQLRYYWDVTADDCLIKHSDARLRYGYEYMGATSRLVITPLTDRCWLTLTGAYRLKLGAAPAGPAGTGKTESSKDLAKAMAILCVVFNCSDQIDYAMMGKLFRGLAQCGCWACLDEFNRIDIEVLSVIAQQLLILREGRIIGKSDINFMGVQILLKDHHVIITMNPGYAGRTELPDNLQTCFRPVAMMVPNYGLIAEIMLFSEGFSEAKSLSRKMCTLYTLCSEQLSQQPHYDYGLRAVKAVLVMAGLLKRSDSTSPEGLLLIRALRDLNAPKFTAADLPLFSDLLRDLFPGMIIPEDDRGNFQQILQEELAKESLQNLPELSIKVSQLTDILNIRFGASLVGAPAAGKTTCYRMLAATMTSLREKGSTSDLSQRVHLQVLNPKCVSMGELYGEFNPITQEWYDGLASTILRAAVAEEGPDYRWTVFDGPIDALWIENMNTVLDDNMTLCLANGERIKLKSEMKMIFEVLDLAAASPATVSRIGVIYISRSLPWMPFLKSWLARNLIKGVPEWVSLRLQGCFEKVFGKVLDFQRSHCCEPIPCIDLQLATSLVSILQSLLATVITDLSSGGFEMGKLVDRVFVYSLIWSVGVSIDTSSWEDFDHFIRRLLDAEGLQIDLPSYGLAFDYVIDVSANKFVPWSDILPPFKSAPDTPYFQLYVPTVDTTRYSFLLSRLISVDKPAFVTGGTGTGKTIIIQSLLKKLSAPVDEGGTGVLPVALTFSTQSSSLITQLTIESSLQKKRKTLLGAPAGRKVVLFVDDISMPAVEQYGAQPPIELLRQLLDFRGFYDRQKLFWKDIQDLVLVAAAPSQGGQSSLTPRFLRHFNILCLPAASKDTMSAVFQSILSSFLSKGFQRDVQLMTGKIVEGTISLYQRISRELLPTPAKFHYTFNLRDVSKVFQGLLMIRPERCQNMESMIRLWWHECMRVFHDRLNCVEDQDWYHQAASNVVETTLQAPGSTAELCKLPIIYCDFLRPVTDIRPYEEVGDMTKLADLLDRYLEEYNTNNGQQMDLVFFNDAIVHICRISRILRQPRGNAMLMGLGGSGKQSLTRMAAYIAGYQCVQIETSRGYGMNEFHEDVKKMMNRAGVEGLHTVFLFGDTQIVKEDMLEDLNNALNSGEIPNLFSQEELTKVVNDMMPVVKAMNLSETKEVCLSQFNLRVRDFWHVVLCMSPTGGALRLRCRRFPSLINCTTIDCFLGWPRTALVQVAKRYLNEVKLPAAEIEDGLISMCELVHTSVTDMAQRFYAEMQRTMYTTPQSYLGLLYLYRSLIGQQQEEVEQQLEKMAIGVQKLDETGCTVAGLKEELSALEPVLAEKSAAAEKLLKQVATDQAESAIIKEKVSAEADIVNKQTSEVQEVQAEAQKELDLALPALNNAVKSLDSISKSDITIVKSFQNPPPLVKMVMEAVCVMFDLKPDWDNSKKLLGDSYFIEKLKSYDKDSIEEKLLRKLRVYLESPSFTAEAVMKVSSAAAGLCTWVGAMDMYARVAKDVDPKRKRLADMSNKLDAANLQLAKKKAELQEVVDKVDILQRRCEVALAEKEQLASDARTTASRLVKAEKLISGLASEGERWRASLVELAEQRVNLLGDVFLGCASICYYGPLTGPYREVLVQSWLSRVRDLNIPCSASYSLPAILGDPVEIREWQNCGLPTDSVSTCNAVIVTRTRRWPLMIDPQLQANKWIRKKEEKAGLEIIATMSCTNLSRTLESCVRLGKPLLIEDVGEQLDPSLDPILTNATAKRNGRYLIRLSGNDVDYDPAFRLYMTSKLANPHYLPQVCIKTTIINFTVTIQGLEEQLLGDVVRLERPEVEDRKGRLVVRMADDRRQLQGIERKILKMLSESTGDVLGNDDLIDTLAASNTTSRVIKERIDESQKTEKEIDEARGRYRPAATQGSILYFVIADLASIDPMYQYSLSYCQTLFNRCIEESPPSENLQQRLATIIETTTQVMYLNVCRGLLEKHKLLFSAMVCFSVLRANKQIALAEWDLFVRGPGVLDRTDASPECQPSYLTRPQWDMLTACEQNCSKAGENPESPAAYPFAGICAFVVADWSAWSAWMSSDNPYCQPLPFTFQERLGSFHRLILIKIFREDLLLASMQQFVEQHMGSKLASAPSTSMEDIYADMDNKTPCIFILSPGSDPTGLLLRFARTMNCAEKLTVVSLGQGQGGYASEVVEKGVKSGGWVLLQNCMLAKSWMPSLEKLVLGLIENAPFNHKDFRLFLTSSAVPYFPVYILQNGIKMSNEPPKGVRANTCRSLANLVQQDTWEGCTRPNEWKTLLCSLIFFHANVQERRKFGPLGWNICYAFDESDLETSIATLKRFLEEQEVLPWDALRFVTGHINYGGRVTDDWDRRCLLCILGSYLNPAVLEEGYRFSEAPEYYTPYPGSLDLVMQYFNQLPLSDSPAFFGMHENANVNFRVLESQTLMSTILDLQPRTATAGGGWTPDEMVLQLAQDLIQRVPQLLALKEQNVSDLNRPAQRLESSLTIFLRQEIDKFNLLLTTISSSLRDLQRAVHGIIVMNSDLDLMHASLLNNKVPRLWARVGFASLKSLTSWFKDLEARVAFLRSWVENGSPAVFSISAFFFPQGFLTGILQSFARKHQVAIDRLSFRYNVLQAEIHNMCMPPVDGAYVTGLWMVGARFDEHARVMQSSRPGEMFTALPVLHFIPSIDYRPDPRNFLCPVYKTSERRGILSTTGMSTNYVVAVELPTETAPDTWILCGAAALCQLTD